MNSPDLTYMRTGLFVCFFAESDAGAQAWEELARQSDGTAKFWPRQLPGILAQLRNAGLRVAKAKAPAALTDAEYAELLKPN